MTMSGLRTRSKSESTPKTIRAMMSAAQNHVLSPFTWADEVGPLGFRKVTE